MKLKKSMMVNWTVTYELYELINNKWIDEFVIKKMKWYHNWK